MFGLNHYNPISNIKNYFRKKNDWKITDTIIKAEDVVYGQHPEFGERFGITGNHICIRNYKFSCIYIREEQFEKFKEYKHFYDPEENLINLTNLFRFTKRTDCISQVASKVIPPEVNIKEIKICVYNDITVYITRIIPIKRGDHLFEDLINYQILKEKYHLDIK